MTEPGVETPREQAVFTSERAKTFVDAVVAIAMTLLILPLLESVSEIAGRRETAGEWLDQHNGQIVVFVLSFGIVAMFWIGHHRTFARVERVTVPLLWVLVGWMATIVWLPVPTAMSGQLEPSPVLFLLYIGAMILTAFMNLAVRLMLWTHPALHETPRPAMLRGFMVEVILLLLFGTALVLAEFTPLGYWGLFVLVLTAPLRAIGVRVFGLRREAVTAR